MSKFFDIPWASAGDKTTIPNTDPGSGVVNWTDGWGPNYELDQVTEPSALDVARDSENEFKFQITLYAKELQQTGILPYDAVFDYLINAYVQGSDGNLYRALIANGPSSTPVDPVADATGTWIHIHADLQFYSATFVYEAGAHVVNSANGDVIYLCILTNGPGTPSGVVDPTADFTQVNWSPLRADIRKYTSVLNYQPGESVVGTDWRTYLCLVGNGPDDLPVVNPVGDATGTWNPPTADVWAYDAFFQYRADYYAKGSDGLLYRATTSTLGLDPVGDLTGVWLSVSAHHESPKVTVFTSTDASFALDARTQSFKVTITGAGGGGGGAASTAGNRGIGSGGGGAGTSVNTYDRTDLTGTLNVTIGTGGSGGVGTSAAPTSGGNSSLAGTGLTTIAAFGGTGGSNGSPAGINPIVVAGVTGGVASSGDLNIIGTGSGDAGTTGSVGGSANVAIPSRPGGSIWGAGVATRMTNGNGATAVIYGTGGAGGTTISTDVDGGDGAEGVAVLEEYF